MRRRIHRVLAVGVFLAAVAGLWPSPARAVVACRVHQFLSCNEYTCCLQICTICTDSKTGFTTIDCGDTVCWNKYP
jgi:hypothetical protein